MSVKEPDFTEARYVALIERARLRYRFCRFGENLAGDGVALWRHDIDFSPQRALALARLESAAGVTATYFVLLGSAFYNPFEAVIRDVLREIVDLGHDIGLHYDASASDGNPATHADRVAFEAGILRRQLQADIRSFSLHNPSVARDVHLDDLKYAGLVNASTARLRADFTYVSDSNGRWRYRSLQETLDDKSISRLYALTHPEWWTPEPLPPSACVERCIEGRARCVASDYKAFLARHRPEALSDT